MPEPFRIPVLLSFRLQFREKQQVWLGQVSYLTLDEEHGENMAEKDFDIDGPLNPL